MKENASASQTVVLIGHCGADAWLLRSTVERALPEVRIAAAEDDASLDRLLAPGTLLLVNRVIGRGFKEELGVDLIRRVLDRAPHVKAVLVSNYDDAQQDAEAAGALPGFGKKEIYAESTVSRLQRAAAEAMEAARAA